MHFSWTPRIIWHAFRKKKPAGQPIVTDLQILYGLATIYLPKRLIGDNMFALTPLTFIPRFRKVRQSWCRETGFSIVMESAQSPRRFCPPQKRKIFKVTPHQTIYNNFVIYFWICSSSEIKIFSYIQILIFKWAVLWNYFIFSTGIYRI